MPKIELLNLDQLKEHKCLLAFSYGVDSAALFHLLVQNEVWFDCAFINYKTRDQSDTEEQSAKELCAKFNKQIYTKTATLDLQNGSNFEQTARKIRHSFFDEICIKFDYDTLIFAHQLNDALEWLFMQLSKGSGCVGLCGFDDKKIAKFDQIRKKINIVRPLINTPKSDLLDYLKNNNLKYFIDNSNFDTKFKRNFIRANFSDKFIDEFRSGVTKSLELLRADKKQLLGDFVYEDDNFFIVRKSPNAINLIDIACKKLGILMSLKTRNECIKTDCVISHKISITSDENYYFIAPFLVKIMDKKFKEKCRTLRVPPLLRGFIFEREELLDLLKKYKPLS